MRFHVLSIPQIGTTKDYYTCGFVPTIMNFCRMMKDLGHTVILYTSDENTAPCDEAVVCITKEEQKRYLGGTHYVFAPFELSFAMWGLFNDRAIVEIAKRKQPHDFICSIGGSAQAPICAAHKDLMTVEYQVGYTGVFADYCVFGTNAWRQFVYGQYQIQDMRFFHDTIPLAYDPDDYVVTAKKPDNPYLLYCGRMIPRKGITIALETANHSGLPLKLIGPGAAPELNGNCEFLGEVTTKERNQLMANARAVLMPTTYNEPFGSVAIEAQLCGTPVITTNWGSFPELVENGVNGYRCNLLREFVSAVEQCAKLDGKAIRDRALAKYCITTVGKQYQEYFDRLATLWSGGWYAGTKKQAALWYPSDNKRALASAATKDDGMWSEWEKEVRANRKQFAKSPLFVWQGNTDAEYEEAAKYVESIGPIDLAGKTRDAEFGARVVKTSVGEVTRQWLDSNVEVSFLKRNLNLAPLRVLDIGAGYGRLASAINPFVKAVTCTDAVPTSVEICRDYLARFAETSAVLTQDELSSNHTGQFDLAINIHSWNECSYKQVEAWLKELKRLGVKYLFTVSHGRNEDGTSYQTWNREVQSFRPLIERDFALVAEESIGMSKHPHALWRAI